MNFNLTDYMPRLFGGRFARPPYFMREVHYPASLAASSIATGVSALDAALRSTPGKILVVAHSQGAQVVSHWLREHREDPSAPSTDRLVFLLTGNPLRADGGRGIGRREVGGTQGEATPLTTRWKVIDVARRYDGWADWPADHSNHLAIQNAEAGMRFYHPHYESVELDDPAHAVWTRGTTTFVLTRESPPILRSRLGLSGEGRRAMQSAIERAYHRQPEDPAR